jgi:hypothetical protein
MKDFKEKLAQRESSGDYKAKNKLGYLGKYQFGKLALIDAGYKDKKGNWTGKDGVKSEEDFLNNKEAQENAMDKYTGLQRKYLRRHGASKFIGKEFKGVPITESGLVAAAHLVGAKKLSKSLKKDEDPKDAFGTPATEYLKKFSGYDLDDKGDTEMKEDKLKRMESLKSQLKKPNIPTPEEKDAELEAMQEAAYADGGKKYSIGYPGENIPDTSFTASGSKLTGPETYEEKLMRSGLDPFAPKSPEAQDIKEDMELAAEEDKSMVDTDPDVLPEEPEDKPEALTMDTLEQRFKDLMKSSKKERQTAAWATAASQIASMIDRASANPIGIKPINFQAGDASAEAKDLLALGRMKGLGVDRSMTEYQKAALKERQEDRKLAREKLKALALKAPKQDLTEAEKAVDKAYAKEYANYIAAGGSKTSESDINKLDELAKEMKDNKDIFAGPLDTAVEYLGGFDTFRAAVNPKLQDIKSRLEQIVQQDLRTTLGAQFTEKEGRQFLERSFDPKLGYEENKKRLDDFIKMVKSRANARMKSAKYFEDKGTLKGFKGTESVGESATSDTVLLEAPNGQRKRVKRSAMQKYLDKGAKVVGE